LLTAKDGKLARLKFAILFTTAYVLGKKKTNACYHRIQILGTEISFTPLLSFALAKILFTLG